MSIESDLNGFRGHINKADDKIVAALQERMDIVEQIRDYKEKNHLEVHDEKRVKYILDTRAMMGGKHLSPEFMREIFRLIIKESERLQK